MSDKGKAIVEINRQLAAGRWPVAMLELLKVLEKREREFGF
ncbi:hypothetical protein [Bradyrhizobium sp. BWC-3-1]|nr:hypothetical protein [Bradyrhizobium sp. BWC-3-1]WOH57843.1 hypothetical protein RX329_37910 [Bradyrhizobium sp. BWC-3-1]